MEKDLPKSVEQRRLLVQRRIITVVPAVKLSLEVVESDDKRRRSPRDRRGPHECSRKESKALMFTTGAEDERSGYSPMLRRLTRFSGRLVSTGSGSHIV